MLLLLPYNSHNDIKFDTILRIEIGGELDVQDLFLIFKTIDQCYKICFCNYELNKFFERQNEIKFDAFHSHRDLVYSSINHSIKAILNFDKLNSDFYTAVPDPFNLFNGELFNFKLPIVAKTSHSSPGFTDILGVGKILKEVNEMIKYYFPNRQDKEKNELIKQDRITKQIKNLKASGFTEIEIKEMLLNEDKVGFQIQKLVENKKIASND